MMGGFLPSKRRVVLLAMGLVSFAIAHADVPDVRELHAARDAWRAALERVAPAVVRIDTIGGVDRQREPTPPGGGQRPTAVRVADGPATGVIWSADGLILTSSFNFARDPSTIIVTLHDGRQFVGELIGRDAMTRLAVVKIDASGLPTAARAGRDALQVAKPVAVAGYGHGSRAPTLSIGIVSALQRIQGLAFQLDAKTSPANYGGPVFDLHGRVLGVAVPMGPGEDVLAGVEWYDSGLAFAIDAAFASERVKRIEADGSLRRGYAGLLLDPTTRVVGWDSERVGLPSEGVPMRDEPIGPAADAGLEGADVLIGVDDQPVSNALAAQRILARKVAGDTATVTVLRDGELLVREIELVSRDGLAAWIAAQQETDAES